VLPGLFWDAWFLLCSRGVPCCVVYVCCTECTAWCAFVGGCELCFIW
jgi:hypothetical protein